MLRSVRIALRRLLRSPSFTLPVVLTLALGLGTTTAMYAVVEAVVLRPLPFPNPDELVRVDHPVPGLNPDGVWGLSEAGWWLIRTQSQSVADIGVYSVAEVGLTRPGEDISGPAVAGVVTANLTSIIGARPVVGRGIQQADNEPGAPPIAVLGETLWRTRFDARASVIGENILLDGNPVEVIGVFPSGVLLPGVEPDLWLPLSVSEDRRPVNSHWLASIARLREGVDAAEAQRELSGIVRRFPDLLPEAYYPGFMESTGFSVRAVPLREFVIGGYSTTMWILLAAAGLILVIALANVANLYLVRLQSRRGEQAIQDALGASWSHVARTRVLESGIILLTASVGAAALAAGIIRVLLYFDPDIPRIRAVELGPGPLVTLFAVALAVALVIGIASSLWTARAFHLLRIGQAATVASKRSRRLQAALVIGEIAVSLVVLTAAGLLMRTYWNLQAVDPGFEPDDVLTMEITLPQTRYASDARIADFYWTLTDHVQNLPGVVAVGATQSLPLDGSTPCAVLFVNDRGAQERLGDCPGFPVRVTPGYFRAMGIPVRGEQPTWEDLAAGRGNVVLAEPLWNQLWPDQGPAGQGIKGHRGAPPYYQVVGVAGPVRAHGLREAPVPRVYFPLVPIEGGPLWAAPRRMTLVIRTSKVEPGSLAHPVSRAVAEIEPLAAVGDIETMDRIVASSMSRTSLVMSLVFLAAGTALGLAIVGLYGTISTSVEQRRREISIRRAMGATPWSVRRMLLEKAATLTLVGALLGGVGAIVTRDLLATQLFGVATSDHVTPVAAAAVLLVVAIGAAMVPAQRAVRHQPMEVLREE